MNACRDALVVTVGGVGMFEDDRSNEIRHSSAPLGSRQPVMSGRCCRP